MNTQPNQHTPPFSEAQYIRVRDVEARLRCSKAHVFTLLKNGAIKGSKLGKLLLIDAASVEDYIGTARPWKGGRP